ncbi:MAG: BamA/TamA family outer membrane protein [Cyclobacteriaceae bacterium]
MHLSQGIFYRRFFLLIFLFATINSLAQEQNQEDTVCVQKDLVDVIRTSLNKPLKVKPADASSLLLVPIIGSNPATGFMVGVGGQYAFKMPESKLYSFISGSLQATTKSQYLFMVKNNIYSRKERIFYTGDWRFLIFSQPTYGLGTNSPDGGVLDYQYNLGGLETSSDSLAQPMKFNFARIHQSVGFKVAEGFYLGLGYQFDSYFKIVDEKLRLNPGDTLITSHYWYNTTYGFDTKKYYSSALNASFMIDKRDNMIQAYKGYYLLLGFRGAYRAFGNKTNASMLNVEWRSFHGVSKKNPAHLVAFWVLGNFTKEGDFPYMILPATAYDQRSRSSRGYTQGRYRGSNYFYTEAEYRFPISPCGGVLSGVVFVNATSASNKTLDLQLYESVKAGYGFGLRVMLDKYSRSNLTIDYGFGEGSSGFYLAVSETF